MVSFGRYEPLFRIASGGMAEVYAARIRGEAGFQKLVAVKRMHPHIAHDQSFIDMFLNEARLAAHISSPYVVQTQDLGRGTDGSLYIVMELVVGLSLASLELARRRALPLPMALELLAQAAQGLDDAHDATTPAGDELGLIHRDVSPHNILLGTDGRVRLTDFGIARAIHAPRKETNVKELKGKFGYMSPEQTRLRPLDRRSDLFSLGVVLWEALLGRRLFARDNPVDSIRNVRKLLVPPPHTLDARIPSEVSRVVLKALHRRPSARFQTGSELAEALRRVGRGSLGDLPNRKEIAAFAKEAGGEELARLQRLIRLGTEGAQPAAMEAVRPGSTMVVADGGSGVARIGAPREALDDEPTDAPRIATLILDEDEEVSAELTHADLDDDDARFLAQVAPTGRGDPSLLTALDPESSVEVPDERTTQNRTRPYRRAGTAAAAPDMSTAPPPRPRGAEGGLGVRALAPELALSRDRSWLIGGMLAGAGLLAALGVAGWLLLREPPHRLPETSARLPGAQMPGTGAARSGQVPAELPGKAPPPPSAPHLQPTGPDAQRADAEGADAEGAASPPSRGGAQPTSTRRSSAARRAHDRHSRQRSVGSARAAPLHPEPRPDPPELLDIRAFDSVAP